MQSLHVSITSYRSHFQIPVTRNGWLSFQHIKFGRHFQTIANPVSVMWRANVFPVYRLAFHFIGDFTCCPEAVCFLIVHLFIFASVVWAFDGIFKKSLPTSVSKNFFPTFYTRSFMISSLIPYSIFNPPWWVPLVIHYRREKTETTPNLYNYKIQE